MKNLGLLFIIFCIILLLNISLFVYSKGEPIPPTPTCNIIAAGCHDDGYYTNDKCLENQPQNCDCPSGSSTDVTPITDPDDSEDACACKSGNVFAADTCCGDDGGETDTFCDGNIKGCFEGTFFTDPDDNQYVCETCSQKTWVSGTEVTQCCGDDGDEDDFCNGQLGCFDGAYHNDPDNNQWVCETCAGGTWLNGQCCGDDGSEDTWSSGDEQIGSSCYQGKVVLTCSFPENDSRIVNENGIFSLCGIETDPVTNVNFQEAERCSFKCQNTLFCSYTGNWLSNSEIGRSHASTWPVDASTECCEPNKCWNGNTCLENQKANPTSQPLEGFRCIDGTWKDAENVTGLDEESSGYCPEEGQCLVDLQGNSDDNNNPEGNPQCISNGQFFKDNYCENTVWTSRTKFVAVRLLEIPEGDYSLFCDNAESILNNLQYLIDENEAIEYVGFQRANNFCVLNDNGKIIFGTSLNQEINAQNFPFLNVVGISSCTSALIDDGQYHSCDSSNRVWYNKKTNSVIYSKEEIDLGEINFVDKFINFLKNPIQTIIDKLKGIEPPFDQSFVKSLKKFEKLYVQKSGTKFILGIIEGKNFKNLLIEYRNFQTDICKFIDTYNDANKDLVSGLVCKKEANSYYILGQGSSFTSLDPEIIWQDLTSKLKVE